MIFKNIEEKKPYPQHDFKTSDKWAMIPPRQVNISDITTTQKMLDLELLLSDDSTFYGDLFPHIVFWKNEYYLENGLHRTLRAALQQKNSIHARVLYLDENGNPAMSKSYSKNK